MAQQERRLAVYRRAQSMLARREFSRHELGQRLLRGLPEGDEDDGVDGGSAVEQGVDNTVVAPSRAALVDAVLNELVAVGSLSDERFVSSFVDARVRRGKGPMLIRAELESRGADDALIDRFLTFADAFWIDKVRKVREKRFGAALPADASERQRQARFLAGRGFPADLIRRAFERG